MRFPCSDEEVNDAFKKVDAGEVDFRYIIDMSSLDGQEPDKGVAAKLDL